jgi:hypothetical protein
MNLFLFIVKSFTTVIYKQKELLLTQEKLKKNLDTISIEHYQYYE